MTFVYDKVVQKFKTHPSPVDFQTRWIRLYIPHACRHCISPGLHHRWSMQSPTNVHLPFYATAYRVGFNSVC